MKNAKSLSILGTVGMFLSMGIKVMLDWVADQKTQNYIDEQIDKKLSEKEVVDEKDDEES